MGHKAVLLDEALAALAIQPAGIYIDGTFGRGGHSGAILQQLGPEGRLLAVDKDPEAIASAQQQFSADERFSIVRASFATLGEVASEAGISGKVDGLLLDLGVSSPQLDDAERGFSFSQDGPLDMRMDPDSGQSAERWLAHAEADEIAKVLKEYGEERFAKRIARAIVAAREEQVITTTGRLADIVSKANPAWERGKHPATRSFQAIRIFINRELDDLLICLDQVLPMLAIGGRLAVISFHSLEDRIVKRFIRDLARGDRFPPGVPVTHDQIKPRMKMIGKAIRSGQQELAENVRARSATLRVAERLW
ncbi:MAG: 16S rRNA (cytosine(1402)-N(4))-methyltransferase RsmH [Candidatus Polarisedimenticolaceae bacterium]|nr:16S rRNA (cytosine(1402)-N(4))-methyltransferase RsmH [Candidatus Polarisedimenticolaceae bacterium]